MDEESLVVAARRGDRAAFDRLVERYSRSVVARLLGRAGDLAMAEDLAQETFLRAWQGLPRLENPRAFGSWLLGIGGFVGQEWLRKKQTERRMKAALAAHPTRRPEEGPDLGIARAISELAPEMQQLLALRHQWGLSCEEISRELGKPLGTVTKTLSRVYEQLRARMVKL